MSTASISEYTNHPITTLFPRMKPEDYAALKADIQLHGQQLPIVVLGTQILDGRHRHQACRELGLVPKVTDATGEPFLLIQSLNLRRRHLSADQIAAFHEQVRQHHPEMQRKLRQITEAAQARQMGALKQGEAKPRRSPGKPTGSRDGPATSSRRRSGPRPRRSRGWRRSRRNSLPRSRRSSRARSPRRKCCATAALRRRRPRRRGAGFRPRPPATTSGRTRPPGAARRWSRRRGPSSSPSRPGSPTPASRTSTSSSR